MLPGAQARMGKGPEHGAGGPFEAGTRVLGRWMCAKAPGGPSRHISRTQCTAQRALSRGALCVRCLVCVHMWGSPGCPPSIHPRSCSVSGRLGCKQGPLAGPEQHGGHRPCHTLAAQPPCLEEGVTAAGVTAAGAIVEGATACHWLSATCPWTSGQVHTTKRETHSPRVAAEPVPCLPACPLCIQHAAGPAMRLRLRPSAGSTNFFALCAGGSHLISAVSCCVFSVQPQMEDLRAKFETYGEIRDAYLPRDYHTSEYGRFKVPGGCPRSAALGGLLRGKPRGQALGD